MRNMSELPIDPVHLDVKHEGLLEPERNDRCSHGYVTYFKLYAPEESMWLGNGVSRRPRGCGVAGIGDR